MTDHNPPAWCVFTDGSCWTKDRIGGWAWFAFDLDGSEVKGDGWEFDTTISQMELRAAYEALCTLRATVGPVSVLVFSDSEYVVKGITDRSRARNANIDLWQDLDWAVDKLHYRVEFEHVRGHQDSYYNNLVDGMAGNARKKGQKVNARTASRT